MGCQAKPPRPGLARHHRLLGDRLQWKPPNAPAHTENGVTLTRNYTSRQRGGRKPQVTRPLTGDDVKIREGECLRFQGVSRVAFLTFLDFIPA